jgi:hypothetical protein
MRHIHADKIIQCAKDVSLKVEVQFYNDGPWYNTKKPSWNPEYNYRIIDPYAHLKQALKEGKTIQVRSLKEYNDGWYDLERPILWNSPVDSYRIKPELKPYSFADANFLIGKGIKVKNSDSVGLITRVFPYGVSIANSIITYNELYLYYKFITGEPCGHNDNG